MKFNFSYITILCLPLIVATCLTDKSPECDTEDSFIDKKHCNWEPIVSITNMSTYSDVSREFELEKDSYIQIYAVGELIWNLSGCLPFQFFKSDDVTLFFKYDKGRGATKEMSIFNFSWLDGIEKQNSIKVLKDGVTYAATKVDDSITKEKKYITEVKVPWKLLQRQDRALEDGLEFDITVGDNDDSFKQKAKLRWTSALTSIKDKNSEFGKITFSSKRASKMANEAQGVYFSPRIDGTKDPGWISSPSNEMENFDFGSVKDRYDLASRFSVSYDKENLYLLIETNDSGRKVVQQKDVSEMETFADFGQITGQDGKVIWKMHAANSVHAGGALKNHKTDTLLFLKAGKYTLRYVSDESHSWSSWDDLPPSTSFYGVILYGLE